MKTEQEIRDYLEGLGKEFSDNGFDNPDGVIGTTQATYFTLLKSTIKTLKWVLDEEEK